MRAIRLQEPKHFEYVDIDAPGSPGPGQDLVRTHRMRIWGTDYSGYLGKMPFFGYPRIPGHELAMENACLLKVRVLTASGVLPLITRASV